MVSKLMKHEVLRTRKRILLLFGGATLFAAVGSLLAARNLPLLSPLGLTLAVVATVGLLPALQLVLGLDYWRSSYREFGYFTQTIPTRGSAIYWAKLAWAFLMSLAAVAWSALNGLMLWAAVAASQNLEFGLLFEALSMFWGELQTVMPGWAWPLVASAALMFLTFSLLQYFFAASIGSEQGLRKFGFGGPVIAWFAAYLLIQLGSLASFVVFPVGFGMQGSHLGFARLSAAEIFRNETSPDVMPVGFLLVFALAAVLLAWRTVVSWERKVHLS